MALKLIVDTLDSVPEALHGEYTEGDDGKFKLNVEGLEDTGALKRALEHERTARKEAKTLAQQHEQQLTELQEKLDEIHRGAVPKGDVEALENSWRTKLAKMEKERDEQLGTLQSSLQTLLVDNVAQQLASKISTAPEVMLPHIRSRLQVEMVEGKPATRVLGADGKPSASSVEDLAKEFVANPAFAPIIVGSKASGSGATGGNGGGASSGGGKLDFAKAKPSEIAAYIKAQKERGD